MAPSADPPSSIGRAVDSNSFEPRASIYEPLGRHRPAPQSKTEILKKQITNNLLDIASLHAGVYIMKVIEDGAMTTRKLVIK